MALALGFGVTTALPFKIEVQNPHSPQDQIYTVQRFKDEAKDIVDIAQLRTGAVVSVVGIYDTDYTYRIIVASAGEPLVTDTDITPVSTAGHKDLLEEIRDGVVFYSEVERLPNGPLKSDLQRGGRKAIAAAPVYDADGYLLGYVGFSWKDEIPPKASVKVQAELTARELTRLARIFQ